MFRLNGRGLAQLTWGIKALSAFDFVFPEMTAV
jgi:hypothetical protein